MIKADGRKWKETGLPKMNISMVQECSLFPATLQFAARPASVEENLNLILTASVTFPT